MKAILSNKPLLIQILKILLVLALLPLPFAFSTAKPKKAPESEAPAPVPAAAPAAAGLPAPLAMTEPPPPPPTKKKNKKSKGAPPEPENQLTSEAGRRLLHYKFEVPESLKPAVDFWKLVYSKYDRRFEIFHDTKNLKVIYSVLDFSDIYDSPSLSDSERRALRRNRIESEKDRIRGILRRLAAGDYTPAQLNKEERRIYDLFQDDPSPDKFMEATEDGRVRSQTGIQDKFIAGIQASGQYLEEIEEIFAAQGVPSEITRLVFVESMFNLRARSKVGASGIWQFMPGTGRLFLSIDSVADERNDPIAASRAAAQLLRDNYEALGSWPLAINAYNSGRATLMRAVSALGTSEIATIILYYSGGVYGFASRNFYPCFLAALDLSNHYPKYFGKLRIAPRIRYEYYYPKSPVYFSQLVSLSGTSWEDILTLNPHFSSSILNDQRKLPAGYNLRVPKGSESRFAKAEEQLLSGSTAVTSVAKNLEPKTEPLLTDDGSGGPDESDLISPANAEGGQ